MKKAALRPQQWRASHVFVFATYFALAIAIAMATPARSQAVVKFFDGFGDADLDNNGIALESYDVDVGDDSFNDENNVNNSLTYKPGRFVVDPNADFNGDSLVSGKDFLIWQQFTGGPGAGNQGDADDNDVVNATDLAIWQDQYGNVLPSNPEVTSVLDANDTGLKWFQMRGFTGANDGRSKPTARIVDDTTGSMLETQAVGPGGALGKTAINTGYALSANSRGRGSSIAAFFGENVALGPALGDSIKVSFDFRIWRDASAQNDPIQPSDAELRFGLYQDTDSQLGMENGLAGRSEDTNGDFFLDAVEATWGEEEGWFEGQQIGGFAGTESDTDFIGATGDTGWFASVILDDPDADPDFRPLVPNGGDWRIREETNMIDAGFPDDQRILQGTNDVDTVASPDESSPGAGDFGLANLDVNKVWHVALELVRDTDPVDGAAITANLVVFDVANPGTVYTLTGTEITNDPEGNVMNSADNFDYFGIRNTGFDDFDYLLDNFTLELEGSNAVDGSAAVGQVPEPASLLLLLCSLFGLQLVPRAVRG